MAKTIEDILNQLEDSLNDVNISEKEVKAFSAESEDLVKLNKRVEAERVAVFKVPIVSEEYRHYEYHTRYEYFTNYLAYVDYSKSQKAEYMKGHLEALNKYAQQAEVNNRNLVIVEAILKDEIKKRSGGRVTLYDRGYNDGLKYVNGAINYSKQRMMIYINDRLKEEM